MKRPSQNKDDPTPITTRTLARRDWPAVAKLFGNNGACGGCWCMWWRVPRGGKLWQEVKGNKNRRAFQHLIASGQVHGVLAFAADEPVGWCCFGPRQTFPRLERVRALQNEWTPSTWSVVCFYVARRWRRRGVAARLLQAATARAQEMGAEIIEGYPVAARDSYPDTFAYTGVPSLFEAQGYGQLPRAGFSRPIYVHLGKPRKGTKSKK
jgi:GNAT superfamily N-acetyltransferase